MLQLALDYVQLLPQLLCLIIHHNLCALSFVVASALNSIDRAAKLPVFIT